MSIGLNFKNIRIKIILKFLNLRVLSAIKWQKCAKNGQKADDDDGPGIAEAKGIIPSILIDLCHN